MDSNSNSSDNIISSPKGEIDSDNDTDLACRMDSRHYWNSDNTMNLIQTLEKDCKELWASKHPLHKDRAARQLKLEYLAGIFGTTSEEISRKIHNLRTQFNNELRKIKRRQSSSDGVATSSGWEYFDALSFLRSQSEEPLNTGDSLNLELAEFQADEEAKFGAARAKSSTETSSPVTWPKTNMRVAASAPLPLNVNPLLWSEDAVPRIRPGVSADECQIFGDFVASELRTLRSNASRKKLKRLIQKAILDVDDEEQQNYSHCSRMNSSKHSHA